MIRTFAQQIVSTTLCLLLVVASTPVEALAQQSAPESGGYSGQGAPLSAEELQQLVAPQPRRFPIKLLSLPVGCSRTAISPGRI